MKKINYSLITTILIGSLSTVMANSQTVTPSPSPSAIALLPAAIATPLPAATATPVINIGVKGKSGTVPLKDKIVDENGKKVLTIGKGEYIELDISEANVTLESSNKNSVEIINSTTFKGITAGTEAVISVKKAGAAAKVLDVDKFLIKVIDVDASRQIVAQSTFLPFKTVKDNFGKKFAQSYFVIQVDIRNEKLDKQFIVQTIDVLIDPNQCRNGPEIFRDFDVDRCVEIFKDYFKFPNGQQPIRREEVIAAGKADLNRSNRNVTFRALAFSASVGSILAGFNGLLGRDAVKGVGVLGTTFTDAAKVLIPDSSEEKLENLKNALPTEDVIIKSKESKTFNIFIPTDRVFWKDSWKKYIQPARDSESDAYELKVILDLFLLSSATGVLVDNDAPKVQVKTDDNIKNLKDKFDIILGEATQEDIDKTKKYFKKLNALGIDAAKTGAPKTAATKTLRSIVDELRKEPQFKGYLDGAKISNTSEGTQIVDAIRGLAETIDEALFEKLQDIVINSQK